jgi:hypothetical protein
MRKMGELVIALVAAPAGIIGLVLGLTAWRRRRVVTAAQAVPVELVDRDAIIATQAWNAGFAAHARIARLEDRIQTLEHDPAQVGARPGR